MKEMKFILTFLACAIYTSSWWAAALWGYKDNPDSVLPLLWFLPGVLTVLLVAGAGSYVAINWENER